ncbi:MAG TPA: thioredoxin domain-containing protein [Acetobacteraceae bacterium]|jgi:protein-disulfide isomerase
MQFSRRSLLGVGVVAAATGIADARHLLGTDLVSIAPQALAQTPSAPPLAADDPRMAPRGLGKTDAPVRVDEWFSLTCPHCAAFSQQTFPQVQSDLINTGKLYFVFNDFPLDQVALTAAMVARSLPPERYEPFCAALFASQDRWAFARGVNSTEELAKMAALAGMPREQFDKVIADTSLRNAILQRQADASKNLNIDSTPTFIFNGSVEKNHSESGERNYDEFAKLVAQAAA